MKKILILLAPILLFSGCSPFMAASASKPPDLSVLSAGANRSEIDRELGKPISIIRRGPKVIATYQYFTGDEANYRRAALYAVLDGLTMGISELVTFPMEALQGDKNMVVVTYDHKGRLISTEQWMEEAPLPKPEKLVGLEEALKPSEQS